MNFCTECGNKLDDGTIFCEKCGRLSEEEEELAVLTDTTPMKSEGGIISLLIVAAISVVLAWFGIKGMVENQSLNVTNRKVTLAAGKESVFVGDMSCGFEGASYLLERDDFMLRLAAYPSIETGELSVSDYTYSFPISGDWSYGEAYTAIGDRFYNEQGDEVQDGAELTFFENGDVKVDWCLFYWDGNEYTYVTLMEDTFDKEEVICTSDYAKYEDALDRIDSFEIRNVASDNIFRDVSDGALRFVKIYGTDERQDLYISLSRDYAELSTEISFGLEDFYLSFSTDEDICYDKENVYYVDADTGKEMSYKQKKDGTKQYKVKKGVEYYELKFTVSEEDIKVECVSHNMEDELSYSGVIKEKYLQRRTVIDNK